MNFIAPRVGFISLGCPKNLVDSEQILTQLRIDGYEISADYEQAEIVVVNTCGFIDSAVVESLDTIGEALAENGRVIVTGCLGIKADEIMAEFPQLLAITGPHAYEEVVSAVREHLPPPKHNPLIDLVPEQGVKLTPRHYAYLKISEGCNHKCTFCVIPSMRGKLVSREAVSVIGEARRLVNSGVRELLVVSQDTSAYGVDIKYNATSVAGKEVKAKFYDIAEALGELGVWVRLHYVYPYPHVDDVIPLMAEGKVLPYLDIPFQHASPRILKLMKRPGSSERTLERVKAWRQACPELTIRSTFIVGFPGETEQEFQELLDFLEEAQLDRVGCFAFSPVEGADANDLPDPVPEDVKLQRLDRFMQLAARISAERLATKVGQKLEVLIDQVHGEGGVGRTRGDAPEIDGVVNLSSEIPLQPGQFALVRIIDADQYDLWGEVLSTH